jgi:riboflavin kinase/FMN adenylyltransferase
MLHVDSIDSLSLADCELTIGAFDGVHLGHRQLIARMLTAARAAGRPAAVLSFFPHPSVVLRGWKPAFYLSSPEEKANTLAGLGVDYVVNQTFDAELSRRSAGDFLDWIGIRLHPLGLWVGPDFALGHRREGDIAYLERAAPTRGFELHIVEPLILAGEVVSSTRIRQALWSGEVGWARVLLGEAFSLPVRLNPVETPAALSGIWEARSQVSEERACPKAGWYAARLTLEGAEHPALAHVVHAPTEGGPAQPSIIDVLIEPGPPAARGAAARLAFIDRWPGEDFNGPTPAPDQIRRALEELGNAGPDAILGRASA